MAGDLHRAPEFVSKEDEARRQAIALVCARLDTATEGRAGARPVIVSLLEDIVFESVCDPNQLAFLLFELSTLSVAVLEWAGQHLGASPERLLQRIALELQRDRL